MDSILSVQNQNFSGNRKELTNVLGADVETKSHYLGIIVRQHLTVQRQMVLLREQCAE